ncbi:MAG TPA: prepilin-type N-terminal cleavage/methylation domain-containing protein [Candidatus Goldiibacteriota bacterium]|nr:prepilin-type N-terminal cleavage/methylation domain-containing protein [Candidatus Goldiibacteriota bacterium]
MILRKKKAFTLIEAIISIAILSIVSVGVLNMFRDGMYMWHMGSARITLTAEARLAMVALKKIIQQCQGTSVMISRFNSQQPANSYISAVVTESAFITTTVSRCGCGSTTDTLTVGGTGKPVEVYQFNNYLRIVFPEIRPGTDLTDGAAVEANTYYKTLTVTANLESAMFTFVESKKGTAVTAGIRLSKRAWNNRPPVTVFLKETIMIKRMHSAGYYHN